APAAEGAVLLQRPEQPAVVEPREILEVDEELQSEVAVAQLAVLPHICVVAAEIGEVEIDPAVLVGPERVPRQRTVDLGITTAQFDQTWVVMNELLRSSGRQWHRRIGGAFAQPDVAR